MDSVGQHYQGEKGSRYFAYQSQAAQVGAKLNADKFRPYVLRNHVVVDFGCGGGWTLALIAAAYRVGVEPNIAAWDAARTNLDLVVASSRDLLDSFCDVVISNHALEHCRRPYDELVQLCRALKPGGTMVICLPINDWRSERAFVADPNHHLYTWTPLLVGNLLAEAGLEVRSVRVLSTAWPPKVSVLVRLPRPIFAAISHLWAAACRRRQIMAVATRPIQIQSGGATPEVP